jgi:regulator of sigma E protease
VLLTLIALIVVLGPLIFVHEMGHFLAAKAVGIQVLRFSLGFGRPVLRWRRGETEYWISWLPLGGYVKMAGLEDEGVAGSVEGGKVDVPVDPARAFDRKPVWARLIVICAGVTMNAVLAFVLFAGLAATVGAPELNTTQVDSVVVSKLPPGAEGLATLAPGDRIVGINGDSVRTWDDIARALLNGPQELQFHVAGRAQPVVVRLTQAGLGVRQAVLEALVPRPAIAVGRVEPERAAARAGIKSGDVIVNVDGVPLRSVDQFLARVWDSAKKPLRLGIQRGNDTLSVTVIPDEATGTDTRYPKRPPVYGLIGAEIRPAVVRIRHPGTDAIVAGWNETTRTGGLVLGVLKGLVLRQVSVREIGGPILVAQASAQAARLGVDWLLRFIAFFSINLAVLNLLPIPILDGGQVVFLLAEAIRRKPLPLELRLRLTHIGFVVLVGIMILATSNDVVRWLERVIKR